MTRRHAALTPGLSSPCPSAVLPRSSPRASSSRPRTRRGPKTQIAKYPPGRQASAVIALLWRAQKQNDYWLPKPAIEKVAEMLDMPNIRVLEVATFYTMFNLEPVGRYYVQLCGTTPCMLRGAEDIKDVLRKRVGAPGHVTADGLFSWSEVECLGACCNAPMVQINDDYYEDLTPENFAKLLDDLAAGRPVKTGSQIGRVSSEPVGGLTALTSLYGADGKSGAQGAPAPANDSVEAQGPAAGAMQADTYSSATAQTPAPARETLAPADAVLQSGPAAAATVAGHAGVAYLDEAAASAHAAAEEAHIKETLAKLPEDATPEQKANAVGKRPVGVAAARGGTADNLQRIKGVGPVNEKHLHDLGVFHFDQIAAWTREEIRWVGRVSCVSGPHRPRAMGGSGRQPGARRSLV